MDSGIRRGTDILKALALGADAIMIGRPYLWGLGSFGQPGVERALQILHDELKIAMEFAGTGSIDKIGPDAIGVA
jgi:isopentenyl diphosphate isomerase/L-lactate dehydrogenase-like FMN-dependent dehydrogenase